MLPASVIRTTAGIDVTKDLGPDFLPRFAAVINVLFEGYLVWATVVDAELGEVSGQFQIQSSRHVLGYQNLSAVRCATQIG